MPKTPPAKERAGDAPRRRRLWALASLLCTAGALALVFFRVPVHGVLATAARADPGVLCTALLLSLWLNTGSSSLALRGCVRACGAELSRAEAMRATLGNLSLHNALPAGSGNLGLAAILVRRQAVALDAALRAAITTLWLKLCLLLLLGCGASFLIPVEHGLRASLTLLAAAALVGGYLAHGVGRQLAQRAPWPKLQRVLSLQGSAQVAKRGAWFWATLHTSVVVFGELVVFFLALHALGAPVAWLEVAARLPLVLIAAKLPVTLLGLGTREAAALVLFAGSLPETDIVAGTLLFLALTQLLPAALGALFLRWSPFARAH